MAAKRTGLRVMETIAQATWYYYLFVRGVEVGPEAAPPELLITHGATGGLVAVAHASNVTGCAPADAAARRTSGRSVRSPWGGCPAVAPGRRNG